MRLIHENENSQRAKVLYNVLKEYTSSNTIRDYQIAKGITVDGIAGNETWDTLYKELLKVVEVDFSGYFYPQIYPKKQIIWHHSAGWDNARNMFYWWKIDGVRHVATSIGIIDDGTVYRGFHEDFWAHHIGMKDWRNPARNQEAVAVEICNWGTLNKSGDRYYSTWVPTAEVGAGKVIELNYKGVKYYEAYTDAEIETLKRWTLLIAIRYGIPLDYRENDMWKLSENAKNGVPGIYTHNSFIEGKTDVSPQPKLIAMAESLINYQI